MAAPARTLRNLMRTKAPSRTLLPQASAKLTTDVPIEEQTLPRYSPQRYYPVRLGERFKDRYVIVAKLGYGGNSTVWLARDTRAWWRKNSFVTLKVLTNDPNEKSTSTAELEVSRCIAQSKSKSEGSRYLRTVLDSFEITRSHSTNVVLVYVPMRESLSKFQRRMQDGRLPYYFLKPLVAMLLAGLDHLHSNCRIIHTDLKPDNVLLGVESQAAIEELANEEAREPTPYKIEGNDVVYLSRNFGDLHSAPGPPKITDFGLAVNGDVVHNHPIQANLFQSPEVILGAGWSYSTDIWNLGVMLWDLVENRTLFEAADLRTKVYSPHLHLYEMCALLGRPPVKLLGRGENTAVYFTAEGELLSGRAWQPSALEHSLTSIAGEERSSFVGFVSRMLRWLPEDRATAAELLRDPWLTS